MLACASATHAVQKPGSFFERAIARKRVGLDPRAQAVHGRTLTWLQLEALSARLRNG